jgi:hypothetical protein
LGEGQESNQAGRIDPTTFAQIVVEVNKEEDSAHFAPTRNLVEMFLQHRQHLQVPNMHVDIVAAR